jgi:predicted HTH transcriptional regulator
MIKNRNDIIRDFNRDVGFTPDISILNYLMEDVLDEDDAEHLYKVHEYIKWLEDKYSNFNK